MLENVCVSFSLVYQMGQSVNGLFFLGNLRPNWEKRSNREKTEIFFSTISLIIKVLMIQFYVMHEKWVTQEFKTSVKTTVILLANLTRWTGSMAFFVLRIFGCQMVSICLNNMYSIGGYLEMLGNVSFVFSIESYSEMLGNGKVSQLLQERYRV